MKSKLFKGWEIDDAMYVRGERLRRELAGASYAKGTQADLDPALVPVRATLTEMMWGRMWGRSKIERKTRSFMNIGILMALNRPHELAVNLRMAVNNGLTREEIAEAILHSAAYCGTPAGVSAVNVARDFFLQLDAESAPSAAPAATQRKSPPRKRAKNR